VSGDLGLGRSRKEKLEREIRNFTDAIAGRLFQVHGRGDYRSGARDWGYHRPAIVIDCGVHREFSARVRDAI